MKQGITAKLIGLLFLAALFAVNSSVSAQEPTPTPSPETTETKPAAPPAAAAAPTPETEFWKRDELTGDWSGDRLRLKEEGLTLEGRFTQFYQGIAAGGTRENSLSTPRSFRVRVWRSSFRSEPPA